MVALGSSSPPAPVIVTDHAPNLVVCMALLCGGHALHRARDRLCKTTQTYEAHGVSTLCIASAFTFLCPSARLSARLTVRVLEELGVEVGELGVQRCGQSAHLVDQRRIDDGRSSRHRDTGRRRRR